MEQIAANPPLTAPVLTGRVCDYISSRGLQKLLALEKGVYESLLDCDSTEIITIQRVYRPFQTRNVQKNLDDLLDREYQVLLEFNYDRHDKLIPAVRRTIEVAPGRFEDHFYDGVRLCADGDGTRFVVSVCPGGTGYYATVRAPSRDVAVARELLARLDHAIRAGSIYRGQKIRINGDFLKLAPRTWSDVHVDPRAMEEIRKNVVFPIENANRLRQCGIPTSRGVLLEGPPGTGKSLIGSILASTVSCTFLLVTPQDLERASDVKYIYDIARELAPTIVLLEDLDLFAEDRTPSSHFRNFMGELLNQLDGVETKEAIVTIATTNRPYALDKALVDRPGRFDRRILIDLPDRERRESILRTAIASRNLRTAEDLLLSEVAAATENFSGAHLHDLVQTVAFDLLVEGNGGPLPPLTMAHFRAALEHVRGYKAQCKEMYV
ncbi:MAG: ATP-binding protein [Halobacteria archaeon]